MEKRIEKLQVQQGILEWISDDVNVDISDRRKIINSQLEENCQDDEYKRIMEEKRKSLDLFMTELKEKYDMCQGAIMMEMSDIR